MTTGAAITFLRKVFAVGRRFLWVVVIVGIVLLVLWLRVWSPVGVEVAAVDRGIVTEEAFGRGTIESEREAAVGFDLVGRLSEVLVEEGERVTLGQELARLETDQAQADLSSAKTGVAAARSSLKRLAAEEDRAKALLGAAQREAARTKRLFDEGVVAAQDRDEVDDRLRVARAELDRVLAQRSEATRGIDVASGSAEQRRVAMVRATLLAPFDGLVTRRLREPGDTVAVGSTVLRIVDTTHVHVDAAIDETVLSRLAVNQRSAIFFPGMSEPIAGKVSSVAWESDRQTHELIVEVVPERLEQRVAIGQRADVRVEIARRENVVRVPVRMIHHDGTGPFVYADRDGKIVLVRPTLGLSGNDQVEVLDGLVEGDVVLGATGTGVTLPTGRRWEAL